MNKDDYEYDSDEEGREGVADYDEEDDEDGGKALLEKMKL